MRQTVDMEITIRRAGVQDAKMITDLAARTFYDAFVTTNTPENMLAYMTEAFTVRRLTTELNDPHALFLVGEVDGRPAGYAKLLNGTAPNCITGPNPIEIVRLYVEQQWIGAGIGGALMQACLDEARRLGHQTIYLGVWDLNQRAQSFYRKWGFEMVGSQVFQMGDDPQTDLLMMRKL